MRIYDKERLPILFSAPKAEREAYLMHERHSTQIANHSKSTAFIGRRAGGIDCHGKLPKSIHHFVYMLTQILLGLSISYLLVNITDIAPFMYVIVL